MLTAASASTNCLDQTAPPPGHDLPGYVPGVHRIEVLPHIQRPQTYMYRRRLQKGGCDNKHQPTGNVHRDLHMLGQGQGCPVLIMKVCCVFILPGSPTRVKSRAHTEQHTNLVNIQNMASISPRGCHAERKGSISSCPWDNLLRPRGALAAAQRWAGLLDRFVGRAR